MSLFKHIDINQILDLDKNLLEELPHIFFPYEYYSDHSKADSAKEIFRKIHARLIGQHLMLADALSINKARKKELEYKRQKLEAVIKAEFKKGFNHLKTSPKESTQNDIAHVDPEFDNRIKPQYSNSAKEALQYNKDNGESEGYEHDLSYTTHYLLHTLTDGLREYLEDVDRQALVVAFVGLRRTMVLGLKEIITVAKKVKENWDAKYQYEGEADYVHLLRELEANFPSLDTTIFRKHLSDLKKLNMTRNILEHEFDMPTDTFSEEQLRKCFTAVKNLFETLESKQELFPQTKSFTSEDLEDLEKN